MPSVPKKKKRQRNRAAALSFISDKDQYSLYSNFSSAREI